jgi:hypothetical protein
VLLFQAQAAMFCEVVGSFPASGPLGHSLGAEQKTIAQQMQGQSAEKNGELIDIEWHKDKTIPGAKPYFKNIEAKLSKMNGTPLRGFLQKFEKKRPYFQAVDENALHTGNAHASETKLKHSKFVSPRMEAVLKKTEPYQAYGGLQPSEAEFSNGIEVLVQEVLFQKKTTATPTVVPWPTPAPIMRSTVKSMSSPTASPTAEPTLSWGR